MSHHIQTILLNGTAGEAPAPAASGWLHGAEETSAAPDPLAQLVWTRAQLGEAVDVLAQRAGLAASQSAPAQPSASPQRTDDAALERWLTDLVARMHLEVEPVSVTYADVERLLRGAGPALLRVPGDGEHFLALLRGNRHTVTLIGPDHGLRRVPPQTVRAALCAAVEAPRRANLDDVLTRAGVPPKRQPRARRAILRGQLGAQRIGGCWLLRLSPAAPMNRHAAQLGLSRRVALILGGYGLHTMLLLAAWWLIGRGVLLDGFDRGWLGAWALVLLSTVPFQTLATWSFSRLAVDTGTFFKERLLYGMLQLEPAEIRQEGSGQFLGRVMESAAFERLALAGGFVVLLALIQLGMAVGILALGASGWLHALLLVLWSGLTFALGWANLRAGHNWIDAFRAMTNDLVERMVGHRTRLVQEDRSHWHADEDRMLAYYLARSQRKDQVEVQLEALIPRGWMVLGLIGVVGIFFVPAEWRNPNTLGYLAISLGGVLLAYQALTSITTGMQSIIDARLAWDQIKLLFNAAPHDATPAEQSEGSSHANGLLADLHLSQQPGQPVASLREVSFRYSDRQRYVLRDCTLQLAPGERWLLEGPSGGGKSTLAALLAGMRSPEIGTLLLWGLDQETVGRAEWRRRVVMVPQFHENHIFTGTLAFNLLMGRDWPPTAAALTEAEEVCGELGLDDLLDRMPAGLQQMVGEGGWRLSHGERSRIFMARALLQEADLIILDESFGALDPETMQLALQCVLQRAKTLLVIAHP